MNNKSFESFEEHYKQGLVQSASVPRMVLMLYDKLLLTLKQALQFESDYLIWRQALTQASQILNHLMNVFLQSKDEAYLRLYTNHEPLSQKLSWVYQQKTVQLEEIIELIDKFQTYRKAWRQQLQIKSRQPMVLEQERSELDVSEPANPDASDISPPSGFRLNVRPYSED